MQMHNPPHPGAVLKELCIEPLNLTVTETAEALGVSLKPLSAIWNGKAGISPETAIRLGEVCCPELAQTRSLCQGWC